MSSVRLYTFAISHFSEKARWALELEGIGFEERYLLPGPHVPRVRAMAPKTSVPVLVHDGQVVQGSSEILDYAQRRLGATRLAPAHGQPDEDRDLEALADRAFGLGVQRIGYESMLKDRRTVVDLWSQGGPRWARVFYAVAFPAMRVAVERRYNIRPDKVEEAKTRFARAMDRTDALLEQRAHLGGDRPGRADVTVAALLAPLCLPPEHPIDWPELPAELASFADRFQGRPTWNHALRMYREHRRAGPA